MKASIPKRFLTLRDKGVSHKQSKSSEGHKSRPPASDTFFSLFTRNGNGSHASDEDVDKEKESLKIEEISKQLVELNVQNITTEDVQVALRSRFAAGDIEKAIEVLIIHRKSRSGIVEPYNPHVQMVGAENRGNVTCYLDALLFAMFAKLEAFECMLKNDSSDETQQNLATLVRFWVNMLRSGKLIHTDITQRIQDALAACGWKDAQMLEQQDTSEAFAFITETLQLPLLSLQVDLFHQGKGDADDHKVVYERLLNLAVPADPEGKGIKLEDCLEEYFNTQVDVLRDGVEEKRGDRPVLTPTPRSTIRLVQDDENTDSKAETEAAPEERPEPAAEVRTDAEIGKRTETEKPTEAEASDQVDLPPLQHRITNLDSLDSPSSMASASTSDTARPSVRHRSTSIIQRIVLDQSGRPTDSDADAGTLMQKAKRKGATVVKAVTIPAWQFFRLIPWHATSNAEPQTDVEVVRQFKQRPVVGICLKRYIMTENGFAKRHNTFIDIPDSLRLPYFMMVNDTKVEEDSILSTEYKLVLQSVVCHRGDSLHSGHYVSFARVDPKIMTDNRRHDNDPPPDYEEAQWMKFDDLADERVTYVDDIKESLKEEMPYLLFYQILPMVDVTAASTGGDSEPEPPSYNDSAINVAGLTTPSLDSEPWGLSRPASDYFDNSLVNSTGPNVRFSSELDPPPRLSLNLDEDPHKSYQSSTLNGTNSSRRASVAFSESTAATPAITPDVGPSPAATPEETTAQRLSRAAAKFTKSGNRTRPSSQVGEGRISITMSRLTFRTKSKEPLREAERMTEDGEETPVATERLSIDDGAKKGKDHHHHHKLRAKSKSRTGLKETGVKEPDKAKNTGDVPDRECTVM